MKWITRERVKVDRVACPWLINHFVDKDAEFVFVPPDKVMEEAKRLDAIPYDVGFTRHFLKVCAGGVFSEFASRKRLITQVLLVRTLSSWLQSGEQPSG